MIYALSIHWLRGREPDSSTAFVLTDESKAFKGRAHEALSHLPDAVWSEVEALQSYHRARRPELGQLLALSTLVNADKHRSIQPTYTRVSIVARGKRHEFDRLNDGDRMVVRFDPDSKADLEAVGFTTAIGFLLGRRDGQLVGIDGLRQIHDLIRDKVLPRFEPFFSIEPPEAPIVRAKPTRRRRRRR